MERDAYAIWWYNRLQRPQLDLSQFDDSYVRDLQRQLAESGRKLWVLDVTSDLGVPTFVAVTHWMQNGRENIEFGSGAHFDRKIALLRALTELNQFLSLGLMGGGTGEKSSLDGATALRLDDYPYLTPSGKPLVPADFGSKFGDLDTSEQVSACVRLAKQAGLDFLVLDQTRPDIEAPVVRVIVPGLRHFYRRLGRGRLYDVPIKLGLRDRPLKENEFNLIYPHLKALACELPDKRECEEPRQQLFPPGSAATSRSKRRRREKSPFASRVIRSAWDDSARAPRIARKTCA